MAVTSTTLAGVNVWQFSGAVTDAEINTAWAALIVNNRYKPGRYIYIDSTCSLVNVRGTYYVDCEAFGIILHSSRNKTNTLFSNWVLTQTVGLSVAARSNFVRVTNGTTITNSTTDGIDMKGGAFIYAVQGNPGGGDPRYLNEMMFGSLDGTVVTSAAYTEQEVEPTSIGTIWRGLNVQKAAGYPILANSGGTQRQVIYRSNFNTEGASLRLVRPYYNNSICYVSSTVRRQGATVTANLLDTFGSTGSTVVMVLNNYTDESWFGATKTSLGGANWNAGNRVIGGVAKKILVKPNTLIRCYDSRSTTTSQKSTFSETTQDFLSGTNSTTASGVGKAAIVCVGAIATGAGINITRYTGQKFTLQKFGYKVQVETPDMSFGDDDLSAFSPITMTVQDGIVRSESAINAATTITSFQDLLEELHVLAIAQVGAASYNGYNNGNLFSFSGGELTTNFTSVVVDATAASKISYNSATNSLTIKSSILAGNNDVFRWNNPSGTITTANGAQIQGVYQSSAGTSTIFQFQEIAVGTSLAVWDASGTTKYFQGEVSTAGTYSMYIPPGASGTYYYAIEQYGKKREEGNFPSNLGGVLFYVPAYAEDVGIVQTTKATVAAYTDLNTLDKVYDYTAYKRLSEPSIKQGQIATRSGTAVDIGLTDFRVNHLAASMFAITGGSYTAGVFSGGTITIKASALASGTKYSMLLATPPKTVEAVDNENITCDIEDGNGDSSVNISASGISTFELWKITDATDPDDYATGTLLATVGIGKYRFIHADGYKMVIRDTTTNFRVVSEMEKGVYEAALFFGAAVQLAQAAEVSEINNKVDILTTDLEDIKGTGFMKDNHSLTNIKSDTGTLFGLV